MHEVLRSLAHRDREVLSRFYLLEQPREQICAEMGVTQAQFRRLKSKVKTEFAERARRPS